MFPRPNDDIAAAYCSARMSTDLQNATMADLKSPSWLDDTLVAPSNDMIRVHKITKFELVSATFTSACRSFSFHPWRHQDRPVTCRHKPRPEFRRTGWRSTSRSCQRSQGDCLDLEGVGCEEARNLFLKIRAHVSHRNRLCINGRFRPFFPMRLVAITLATHRLGRLSLSPATRRDGCRRHKLCCKS